MMKDAAAASPMIGFGWFLPGIGIATMIADEVGLCVDDSGCASDVVAGAGFKLDMP